MLLDRMVYYVKNQFPTNAILSFIVKSTALNALQQLSVMTRHVNLTQARAILEEGTLTEKIPPPDWPIDEPAVHFLNQ